jgi:hypothetical protein
VNRLPLGLSRVALVVAGALCAPWPAAAAPPLVACVLPDVRERTPQVGDPAPTCRNRATFAIEDVAAIEEDGSALVRVRVTAADHAKLQNFTRRNVGATLLLCSGGRVRANVRLMGVVTTSFDITTDDAAHAELLRRQLDPPDTVAR